jgi:hypothetical protein
MKIHTTLSVGSKLKIMLHTRRINNLKQVLASSKTPTQMLFRATKSESPILKEIGFLVMNPALKKSTHLN